MILRYGQQRYKALSITGGYISVAYNKALLQTPENFIIISCIFFSMKRDLFMWTTLYLQIDPLQFSEVSRTRNINGPY